MKNSIQGWIAYDVLLVWILNFIPQSRTRQSYKPIKSPFYVYI